MAGVIAIAVCPACRDWQLEYDSAVLFGYIPSYAPPAVGAGMAMARLDDVLLEHLLECFGVPV